MRGLLALVALLGRLVLRPLVPEGGVVVEGHLGVEGMHAPVGREDQRVDLDQVGVTVDVRAVQLHEHVDRALGGGGIQVRAIDPLAGDRLAQAVHRVDVQAGDRLRLLRRDLLDVDAPACRQHPEVQLGRAVERERRVVLLGDVARTLDPKCLDDVAPDVHAQDVERVRADGVGVGRELDAARLAAPAHVHLRLDDDGVADAVGGLDRLLDGEDGVTRRHRDAVLREQLLALVLEEVHYLRSLRSMTVRRSARAVTTPSAPRERRASARANRRCSRAGRRG